MQIQCFVFHANGMHEKNNILDINDTSALSE